MLIRVVRMTFRADSVDKFLELFRQSQSKIIQSPGCRKVTLLQDHDHPYIYITYSHWDQGEDLERYRQSPLFKEIWSQTKPLFGDRPQAFSMKEAII